MTRHTQKNNIEKTLPRPFFFVDVAFFFFSKCHTKHKAKNKTQLPTPGVQNQRSVVIIMVHQVVVVVAKVVVEKNSMVKKKKKFSGKKKENAKKTVKKQKIGAAHVRNTTLLLPTGPHYHTTTLSQTRVA